MVNLQSLLDFQHDFDFSKAILVLQTADHTIFNGG